MKIITAREFRATKSTRRTITVGDMSLEVQSPDMLFAMASGRITSEQMALTLALGKKWEAGDLAAEADEIVTVAEVIDEIVCLACINPRVSRVEQPNESDQLWIGEIHLLTKLGIVAEFGALVAAASATPAPPASAADAAPRAELESLG